MPEGVGYGQGVEDYLSQLLGVKYRGDLNTAPVDPTEDQAAAMKFRGDGMPVVPKGIQAEPVSAPSRQATGDPTRLTPRPKPGMKPMDRGYPRPGMKPEIPQPTQASVQEGPSLLDLLSFRAPPASFSQDLSGPNILDAIIRSLMFKSPSDFKSNTPERDYSPYRQLQGGGGE